MKGKTKFISILLSIAVAFSFAVTVKAEDNEKTTKITYTVEGEKTVLEDGREAYANEVKVIFKVETNEEIKKIELLDDTGKWLEQPINDANEYIAQTTKAGEYLFQLKVLGESDKELALSEEVKVLIDKVDVPKDDENQPNDTEEITPPSDNKVEVEEHEHDYFDGLMNMSDPIETEDGYVVIIPCSEEGCKESIELKFALYKVVAETNTYDLSQGKDITYTTDAKGELISVTIDDEYLIEDDEYTVNKDGTVTIKKSALNQLDKGNYEVSFIYMEILNEEELNNLDMDDPNFISKLFKNIKMGIAFTDLTVIGNKPVTVTEEVVNKPVNTDKKEPKEKTPEIVKTDDNSLIELYIGLMGVMGISLILLRKRKSA